MRFVFITLFLPLVCGCSFGGQTRSLDELESSTGSDVYRAKSGDTLDVQVWGEPRVSGEYTLRQDGKFTMGLVGDIEAENKTLDEISDKVTSELKTYIPGASVTVSVAHSAPIRYYLSGAFLKPDEYRSDSRVTLLQAIARGGGFAPFADKSNILLIRNTPEGEIRYKLDYNAVINGEEPNPELKNGDIIAVQ